MRRPQSPSVVRSASVLALVAFSWPIVNGSAQPFRPGVFWHFVGVWLCVLGLIWVTRSDDEPPRGEEPRS